MAELPLHGFVKICGVTNVDDARSVVKAGADALGLNFATSPRHVSRDEARVIVAATNGDLLRCAVFGDQSDDEILNILNDVELEMVQLHGALSATLLASLRQRHVLVVKALTIESDELLTFDDTRVDAVLVDGPRPGSGVAHSWDRLIGRGFHVPVIAAGGLTPLSVAATIHATNSWGVDCASGVEASARCKDSALVTEFVARARQAFTTMGETRVN